MQNSKLQAAYFMKSVLARANLENADLSDALMDRAVIVQANLKGAVLQVGAALAQHLCCKPVASLCTCAAPAASRWRRRA